MGEISTAGYTGLGVWRSRSRISKFSTYFLLLLSLLISCGVVFADSGQGPMNAALNRLANIEYEVDDIYIYEVEPLLEVINNSIEECDPLFNELIKRWDKLIDKIDEREKLSREVIYNYATEIDKILNPDQTGSELSMVKMTEAIIDNYDEDTTGIALSLGPFPGSEIIDMAILLKDIKKFSEEMKKEKEILLQRWKERQPCERPEDTPVADSFFDVFVDKKWFEGAKPEVTDSQTGAPLDDSIITVYPRDDTVVKDPSDNYVPQQGDTIIVSAPCHEKNVVILGEDDPASVFELDPKPIRFTVVCDEFEDAEERIREELAKQGITYDRKDTAFAMSRLERWDGKDLCIYSVLKYQKKNIEECPCEITLIDEQGRFINLPKDARQPPGTPPLSPIQPDQGRQGEEWAAFPDDPLYSSKGGWGQRYDDQWGLKRIGFDFSEKRPMSEMWPDKAEPVIVAVVDTGVDRDHPELFGSVWFNRGEIPGNGVDDDKNGYVDDCYGWNFVDDNNDTLDNNGHGTVVAGVIAAWPGNGRGIAGVNPWARIMPVKATDFDNRGWSIDVGMAIKYAADNGARVINVSIGGKNLTDLEQAAITYATEKGAVVVVAAGNKGVNTNNYSPAGLAGAVTVAATDMNDERVGFSNWGQEVDISAPGVDILSLRAKGTDLLVFEKDDYVPGKVFVGHDKMYYRVAGTSFSAPFVSGVASLIFSINPELDNTQVTRMILQSARDISVPGFDQYSGYGILDAGAALKADPDYYIDSRLLKVSGVKNRGKIYISISGVAMADKFDKAWIEAGKGREPKNWIKISDDIKKPVNRDELALISPAVLKEASEWTLRLVVKHKNNTTRESRYELTLR